METLHLYDRSCDFFYNSLTEIWAEKYCQTHIGPGQIIHIPAEHSLLVKTASREKTLILPGNGYGLSQGVLDFVSPDQDTTLLVSRLGKGPLKKTAKPDELRPFSRIIDLNESPTPHPIFHGFRQPIQTRSSPYFVIIWYSRIRLTQPTVDDLESQLSAKAVVLVPSFFDNWEVDLLRQEGLNFICHFDPHSFLSIIKKAMFCLTFLPSGELASWVTGTPFMHVVTDPSWLPISQSIDPEHRYHIPIQDLANIGQVVPVKDMK